MKFEPFPQQLRMQILPPPQLSLHLFKYYMKPENWYVYLFSFFVNQRFKLNSGWRMCEFEKGRDSVGNNIWYLHYYHYYWCRYGKIVIRWNYIVECMHNNRWRHMLYVQTIILWDVYVYIMYTFTYIRLWCNDFHIIHDSLLTCSLWITQ